MTMKTINISSQIRQWPYLWLNTFRDKVKALYCLKCQTSW